MKASEETVVSRAPDAAAAVDEFPPRPARPAALAWRVARRLLGSRLAILVALNVGFALGVSAATPYFLTLDNFEVMFVGSGMEFVMTALMTFLLVARMFDLSIDGVINMAGVVGGLLMVHDVPVPLAVAITLLSGLAVGLVNGVAVTKVQMNPLMTTLATWWMAQGIAYGLTLGISPHRFPTSFHALGADEPLGLAMPIWYMIVLIPPLVWALAKSRFGYHVYATGGDPEAARLRAIRVNRVVIVAFVAMGVGAALTGLVYASRLDAATPVAVNGANLRVIAGAVIGGCSLSGGRGGIPGAMLGLLFMTMLTNATVILGLNPYWQYTILGGVVFAAVAADAVVSRRTT